MQAFHRQQSVALDFCSVPSASRPLEALAVVRCFGVVVLSAELYVNAMSPHPGNPSRSRIFSFVFRISRIYSNAVRFMLPSWLRTSFSVVSLRRSIVAGRAEPTEGPADSTVHLTIEDTTVGGVSVRILDCAGQVRITCRGWEVVVALRSSLIRTATALRT